jgi:hypothetical protein
MGDKSINRVLLIVGLLTVLFLFKEYVTSAILPEFPLLGLTITFERVWFFDIVLFAITLFLFAFASIGIFWYWSNLTGLVFYFLSVIVIPGYFLACGIRAFLEFQNQHWVYFRVGGVVIVLGFVVARFIWWFRKR